MFNISRDNTLAENATNGWDTRKFRSFRHRLLLWTRVACGLRKRDARVVREAWGMTKTSMESFDIAKLEEAVIFTEKAAKSCAYDPILRSDALNTLGRAYQAMFEETGQTEYVETGVETLEEAVYLCPPTHPGRPARISNLASILHTRFEIGASVNDLDRCVALLEETLAISPLSTRSVDLNNLSASLSTRFQATANIMDLDRSIDLQEESLQLASHSDRSHRLNSLAVSLGMRFQHRAALPDLERAATLLEQALLIPQSTEDRHHCLSSLATSLWTRYKETRNVADLNRAITLDEEALELCPPTHIDRSDLLEGLAISMLDRFRLGNDIADLSRAIELQREAIALVSPNHVDQPRYLVNLAKSYSDRFELNTHLDDLEQSIALFEQALNLYSPTHIHRHRCLAPLARSLSTRFKHQSDIADLHRSIELAQSALESFPPHHPRRSECLEILSTAQLHHIRTTSRDIAFHHVCGYSTLSIDQAISQLRTATNIFYCPSHDRLDASLSWVDASAEFDRGSLFDAYTAMFDALDTVVTRGHSLESRYSQLTTDGLITKTRSRITNAVSFAISENRPRDAVVFSERGRALLLAQVSSCRMPLDIVKENDAKLAEQLEAVGQQLERLLASNTNSSDLTPSSVADDRIAQSMRLSSQWDALVEQARKLDGCDTFLRPTPFESLRRAAYGGPIINTNINEPLSHAIIVVHQGDPLIVPLPHATPVSVRALTIAFLTARHQHISNYYSALRTLWDIIVGPVAEHLQSLVPVRSRIWWCPSAAVSQLPLHAAGHYTKSAPRNMSLPHIFVSSYTSSLGALTRAHRPISHLTSPKPSVVVISQPKTEGQVELNVQAETAYICNNLQPSTLLEGPDGTPDAVISLIPNHLWAHFSCHGCSTAENPLRSYFPLHGGHLEVLDILRTQMPDAELAVLTACHSASADTRTPDEFLHLAGAMQFAGFRSVVGTLWEMDDEDGALVVKEFYRLIFEELERGNRSAYTCAAQALNEAVQKLRRERKVPPWRWVNYVHYGA